ncbi:hypothetical protein [Endozoicomonas sp.]|uniref:hypothetical protein n=1 Tax=Endozoicomonas sp. TaxID=1892382 RepID=UPI00288804AF|nr:hypothetical protein [Endozoicomonas sp.]
MPNLIHSQSPASVPHNAYLSSGISEGSSTHHNPPDDLKPDTGKSGSRSVSNLLKDCRNYISGDRDTDRIGPVILRRQSIHRFAPYDIKHRPAKVATDVIKDSVRVIGDSVKKGCGRTVDLCPEPVKQIAGSVQKGGQYTVDHCPNLLKALVSRAVQKVALAYTIMELIVPCASATVSTVTGYAQPLISEYCHPSFAAFKEKMLAKLGGSLNVIDTNGNDTVRALNGLMKDDRDVAMAGFAMLGDSRMIKANVNSYEDHVPIKTGFNYLMDRALHGARNGTEPFRDLDHLLNDEFTNKELITDYIKRALSSTCVPINYETIACGQITVGDYWSHVGEVFGLGTNIKEASGSTTDLFAQAETVKAVNPGFYDSLQKMLDAKILLDSVVSKVDGRRLFTIKEYINDRLLVGEFKTIGHVISDELSKHIKLDLDVAVILRPDCAPTPLLSPTEDAVAEVCSSMLAAFQGGVVGVCLSGGIAAGFMASKAIYRHVKSQKNTDKPLEGKVDCHSNPAYSGRVDQSGVGGAEGEMTFEELSRVESFRSVRSANPLIEEGSSMDIQEV